MRFTMLVGVGLLALSSATVAAAQDGIQQKRKAEGASSAVTTSANGDIAGGNDLPQSSDANDIVVTAQRRSESLRDVPIAVTVIGGDSFRQSGATQLTDIQQRAPSLQFAPVPGNPSFVIRGIGTASFDYSIEAAVGLAVDDVNLTLPRYTPLNTLADVDRIEVLRGPQGLLFGKNTTAGLISVTTRRPQLGVYSNEGRVQYGSRDQIQVYDIVNLPLGQNAALRVRAGYQFQTPVYNVRGLGRIENTRSYNANAKLLWNVTDKLSAYAIVDYQDNRGDPGVWSIRSFGTGTFAPAAGNRFIRTQLTALGIAPGPENRDVGIGTVNTDRLHSLGAQLSLDYDLGPATITSTTAYRNAKLPFNNLEVDSTPLPVYDNNRATLDAHQFTQELRIGSNGDRQIDYVAGLYFFDKKVESTQAQFGTLGFLPSTSPILLSTTLGLVSYEVRSKSYAAFAQLTAHLGDRLRLIGGVRYTRDEVDARNIVTQIPNVCSTAFVATGGRVCQTVTLPATTTGSRDATGWSARGGVQYDVANAANLYVTYSRGYKGPAISTVATSFFTVDPETVDAYEAGIKTEFFDRRVSLNLAAFTNDFRNFQAQVFDPTIGTIGALRTGNAGKLRTRGVEAEAVVRPVSGLSLSGGVTYLDTKYLDYRPPCYAGQTAAQGCTLPGPTFDAAGQRLVVAPKWATSLAASYEKAVTEDAKFFINTDWSYRSSVFFGVGNPGTVQPGYSLVNVTVGVGSADDKIRASVFVRNAFDQRFASLIFPSYFDTGGFSQILPDNAFRRVGGAIEWRF